MISKRKIPNIILFISGTIFFVYLLLPHRNARGYYPYIPKQEVWSHLHKETSPNLTGITGNECEYERLIMESYALTVSSLDSHLPESQFHKDGGEYMPPYCLARFSVAIVVPYRDRVEHLKSFLIYMHNFLRRQQIHFKLYVVDQIDEMPFNRAKLLNIGAIHAIKEGFPCIILHDVDLLPLTTNNIYACAKQPRHMSSHINKFRFNLPYMSLFGGAVSILSAQFKLINGMSNAYYGWGAEDDDLYQRLAAHQIQVCRFEPEMSKYIMMRHQPIMKPPAGHVDKLVAARTRMQADGLSSLEYNRTGYVLHPLFTHIMVSL